MGSAIALSAVRLPADFVGLLLLYWWSRPPTRPGSKRLAVLDVHLLAGLYTLRVLAGGPPPA